MRSFDIPTQYKSSFIGTLKEIRKQQDPRKKDFSPSILDFGPVQFNIARHFGFCYGVENAIEISYRTVAENPGKRIFLLSQMIHNPVVNEDLKSKGIEFIMDTEGNHFVEWNDLTKDDIVIIPAFGTTIEIEKKLADIGIQTQKYDTTCPFVNKVWTSSRKLGVNGYSILIHGKFNHEETRATFSHSSKNSPSLILKDINEAKILGDIILEKRPKSDFEIYFKGKYSSDFDVNNCLDKLGVINQTTMLASETHEISNYFKDVMVNKFGNENIKEHFADTRDTLCYATNDNQQATFGLLESVADLAIIVGGFNSSNTSHIVELCEQKFLSYFISGAQDLNIDSINHFDIHSKEIKETFNYIPVKEKVKIVVTSGASCPDSVVDEVIDKILTLFGTVKGKEEVFLNL